MASPLRRLLTPLANGLFLLSSFPAWYRFQKARKNLAATQKSVLLRLLQENKYSKFGRENGFANISNTEEYLQKIPIAKYEDLAPYIELLKRGEQGVLTQERVHMFEPTSGSSSATKYIPYTQTLLGQFQEAVGAWIFDLYTSFPNLILGRAYWCVTPLAPREKETEGAIPVGMEEDSAYFGGLRHLVLSLLLVMPKEVTRIKSRLNFQYITLLFLLAADDLSLISAWSPTFLISLLEPLGKWKEQLADDLEFGTLAPPEVMDVELREQLSSYLSKRKRRAQEVRQAKDAGELWPLLRLVSTWADWTAANYVGPLKSLFAEAHFQPKGLLATEGVVTFPLVGEERGAPLAATSHFFDFVDEEGAVFLAHQLDEGKTYTVNLTTGGGLYRYQLGDRVLVKAFLDDLPLLTFVGRASLVADWFGEKLNEVHVKEVLSALFGDDEFPHFIMLALEHRPKPHYVLWLSKARDGLAEELETRLCENHHYAGCRKIGQLEAAEIAVISQERALAAIVERGRAEERREGDLKPLLLSRRADWSAYFEPSQ